MKRLVRARFRREHKIIGGSAATEHLGFPQHG
jgi:hypothetical protein